MTGERFGPYELLGRIGAGRTGEVHRARDTRLDRLVALKIVHPHLSAAPEFRAAFDAALQRVARLQHPHAVTIHRFGAVGDRLYVDQQLVDAPSLETVLRAGPLPVADAVLLGEQVAAALAAAHALGLRHGNVAAAHVLVHRRVGRPDIAHLGSFGVYPPADPRADVVALADVVAGATAAPARLRRVLDRARQPGGPDAAAFGAALRSALDGARRRNRGLLVGAWVAGFLAVLVAGIVWGGGGAPAYVVATTGPPVLEAASTIAVDGRAADLALAPDGSTLLVRTAEEVSVVDVASGAVTSRTTVPSSRWSAGPGLRQRSFLETPEGHVPVEVRTGRVGAPVDAQRHWIGPDGSRTYWVDNRIGQTVSLVTADGRTGRVLASRPLDGDGDEVAAVDERPGGAAVLRTDLQRHAVLVDAEGRTVTTVFERVGGVAFSPDGREVYLHAEGVGALLVLDARTGAERRRFDVDGGYGSNGDTLTVSGDGTTLHHCSGSSLTVVDLRVGGGVRPYRPPGTWGCVVDPGRSRAYVAGPGGVDVVEIPR